MTSLLKPLASVALICAGLGAYAESDPAGSAKSNQFWWPDQLDLSPLRDHDARSNPLGEDFDYAAVFATLDLNEVKQEIDAGQAKKESR